MRTVAPTFAEITVDRVVFQLLEYRGLVEKHADGFSLTDEEGATVSRMLRGLELPAHCFRRDVLAVRAMRGATTDHRRRELAWLHPHLWTDAEQWAELRLADRSRRRHLLEQIRASRAVYDQNPTSRPGGN